MSAADRPAAFSPRSLAVLLLSLAICFAASTLGGAVTAGPVKAWYPGLIKPPFTPPDIAFPIVWTLLFLLMALAAWRVWLRAGIGTARGALWLFALQLLLNVAWSALFFGLQRPDLALAEVIALWLAIAATALAFRRHDLGAAWMLAPYLAWVSFAIWLNAGIWWLNRAS